MLRLVVRWGLASHGTFHIVEFLLNVYEGAQWSAFFTLLSGALMLSGAYIDALHHIKDTKRRKKRKLKGKYKMSTDILKDLNDYQQQLVLDVIAALKDRRTTSSLYGPIDQQLRHVLCEDTDCIFWTLDDFKAVAEEEYTDDELRQAMHLMFSKHDANIGVNWTVLSCYLPEKEKEGGV